MDATQLLKSAKAFRDKLPASDEQIVEIAEAHGQKFILIHPSEIFPFQALLHYSLIDGKPRVEVISEEGGPHAKSGVPNLRIDVNDGAVWEDEARWPHIPGFEDDPDDINIGVRYLSPDRSRVNRMWRMVTESILGDEPHLDMLLSYATPNELRAGVVVGYGSKFHVQHQDGTSAGDIQLHQIIAVMLTQVES